MVALFYALFFGLGFDFRQNPRILAVIAIHAERENHCTRYNKAEYVRLLNAHEDVEVLIVWRGGFRLLCSIDAMPPCKGIFWNI